MSDATRIPLWFEQGLAIALHLDKVNSWPRWARIAHYLFVSWRCPCCKLGGADLLARWRREKEAARHTAEGEEKG